MQENDHTDRHTESHIDGRTEEPADDLITRYNYDIFTPAKFEPWMNFAQSPQLGQRAPDFPLWDLEGQPRQLSDVWSQNHYTVVEFGSFT